MQFYEATIFHKVKHLWLFIYNIIKYLAEMGKRRSAVQSYGNSL